MKNLCKRIIPFILVMLLIISSTTIVSASSKVVSKNTIINTVLNNRHKLYDFDKQNDYMFADFDFDGNLEFIVSRYSVLTTYHCDIYKVRNKNGKWYLSKMNTYMSTLLSMGNHNFYCYYDKNNKKYKYVDFNNYSPGTLVRNYDCNVLEMVGGKLNNIVKFRDEDVFFNGEQHYYHEYNKETKEYEQVDETKYYDDYYEYFKTLKSLNMKYKVVTIKASDSDSVAKKKLLSSYNAFSYTKLDTPKSVSLAKYNMTLTVGNPAYVEKVVFPATAKQSCVYSTSNSKVATVNKKGKITPKKSGKCSITVKSKYNDKITAKCNITVLPKATKVKLNKSKLVLKKGRSATLKAIIYPKVSNINGVTFKTSDRKIAIVNSKGKITAKKKGQCYIIATAKDGSKKFAKCRVIVK